MKMFLSATQNNIWNSNGLWALVGAVLGFLLSVLLAFIQKKCAIARLIKRLKLELNSVVIPCVKEDIEKEDPDPTTFTSPIWDFVAQTTVLLDVSETLYIRIVNIYVAIKKYIQIAKDGKTYSVHQRNEQRITLLKTLHDNPIDKGWKKLEWPKQS